VEERWLEPRLAGKILRAEQVSRVQGFQSLPPLKTTNEDPSFPGSTFQEQGWQAPEF
jgi:hypothetical protein